MAHRRYWRCDRFISARVLCAGTDTGSGSGSGPLRLTNWGRERRELGVKALFCFERIRDCSDTGGEGRGGYLRRARLK